MVNLQKFLYRIVLIISVVFKYWNPELERLTRIPKFYEHLLKKWKQKATNTYSDAMLSVSTISEQVISKMYLRTITSICDFDMEHSVTT